MCLCVSAFAQNSPVKILEQPKPELPKNYGTNDSQGSIILRVEFLADGTIGNISPISTMPLLTDLAIEAAKKIKFEPAMKDGKPISVANPIGYIYNIGWKIPPQNTTQTTETDEKAEAIVKKAVQILGGDNYLKVKTQIGRGKFSVLRDGVTGSFQNFVDVIVFPDKERTEFKVLGVKTVQTNVSNSGWIFDGEAQVINVQSETQIKDYQRGLDASLDNLLRQNWRGKASLTYVGRREATLGKRNDVVKLTYPDFEVEFEFSAEGLPVKAVYKRVNPDGELQKEEDHYAQFVEVQGIKTPFIVDHFSGGVQTSRINYETIEFNKSVSDSIFTKPTNPKELKKDLKP
jgi:hypothetical protein